MKRLLIFLLLATVSAFGAEKWITEKAPLSVTEQVVFDHPESFVFDISEDPDDRFAPAIRLRGGLQEASADEKKTNPLLSRVHAVEKDLTTDEQVCGLSMGESVKINFLRT